MKKILLISCLCFIACTATKNNSIQDTNFFSKYTENILFKSGTDELLEKYTTEINAISTIIKKNAIGYSFEISGHTDSVGKEELNLALSQKRAEKIQKLLIAQGCEPSKLVAKGYGETKPLVSNKTKEGRKRNRRIEIIAKKL